MVNETNEDHESTQQEIALLVDTLRKCFGALKARYYIAEYQDTLFIEVEGLEDLSETEITEVAAPVLNELDADFEEISLVPYQPG